jgi:murein DD-endopeptidase MepM/ murein hydrolase activator NlpD
MPVKPEQNGTISSKFEDHMRRSPQGSWGIDIVSNDSEPEIRAAWSGVIYIQGWSKTFGNRIWIKNDSGSYSVYPHMRKFAKEFQINDKIQEGDVLGIMGNTGLIMHDGNLVYNDGILIPLPNGEHLHYEERTKPDTTGESIFPMEILKYYL